MKNKIALISYHNEYNYGTMLQAYALYRALQMRGVDSEYISYQISIPSLKQRLFQGLIRYLSHPEKLYTKFAVRKENNQNDFSFFKTEDFKTTIDAFNQWYKEYIPHTHIVYTEKNIQTISDVYAKYIVGSDQVWSPYRNRRIAFFDYFFLNFVLNSSKKYSYAPSFGATDLSSNYLDCIKKALNSFNKISCREVALARKLSELTQKEIVPVIDPTLLLNRTEWKKVCKPVFGMPSEYILCYILGEKKTISQFAEKLSKEKKIPVYYILTRPYYLEKQNCLTGVGPGEFLSLIMNASFVCTDSFHGTIFSINFNVPFYSFTKRESTDSINDNDRIQLVLKEFGLENRFKHDTDMYSNDVFICADEILSTRRLQSGYFLQSIIDETF